MARSHTSPRASTWTSWPRASPPLPAFCPRPVIVRCPTSKSNEYRKLIGGTRYEPDEEPHAGLPWRLALHQWRLLRRLRHGMRGLKRVRNDMGLTNVEIMVPFVRTVLP